VTQSTNTSTIIDLESAGMSERMRKVAAKRGLDGAATEALFVKFCAYYRGNGADHEDWEKTWAGWVSRQYVKVGSPGRKKWEKSEHDNIVKMRSILKRRHEQALALEHIEAKP
jgi:hypothetical protein